MTKLVLRRWDVSQGEMFPPAFKDLVPANHLVHFIREVVIEDLDLSAIYAAYTEHAAVDAEHQVIVSQDVTATQNDGAELTSMVDQIEVNVGARPEQFSADAGYCSEANLAGLDERGIDAYVATGRQKHGTASATGHAEKKRGPLACAMRDKLRAGGWGSPYRLRKHTVEPVFGQIKEARGFRRFLRRGVKNVKAEWSLLCTVHNLLKLAHATAAKPVCRPC